MNEPMPAMVALAEVMLKHGIPALYVEWQGHPYHLWYEGGGIAWKRRDAPPAREVGINVAARHAEDCAGYRDIVDQAGPELARQMWLDFPAQSWIANGPAAGRTARGIG